AAARHPAGPADAPAILPGTRSDRHPRSSPGRGRELRRGRPAGGLSQGGPGGREHPGHQSRLTLVAGRAGRRAAGRPQSRGAGAPSATRGYPGARRALSGSSQFEKASDATPTLTRLNRPLTDCPNLATLYALTKWRTEALA